MFRSPFPHYLHIQTSTVYVTFYLRTAIIWHFYMFFFKNRCAYLVISHIFYIHKSYRKCPVEVCHQTTSLQHQLGSDPVSKYTSCKVVMSVEKDKRTEYIPKITDNVVQYPFTKSCICSKMIFEEPLQFLRTLSCHPTMQPLRQTSGDPKTIMDLSASFQGIKLTKPWMSDVSQKWMAKNSG